MELIRPSAEGTWLTLLVTQLVENKYVFCSQIPIPSVNRKDARFHRENFDFTPCGSLPFQYPDLSGFRSLAFEAFLTGPSVQMISLRVMASGDFFHDTNQNTCVLLM